MLYAVMDGSKDAYNNPEVWGNSAICAVVAIVLVFVVLLLIIGITHLIFKFCGYLELKKEIDANKNNGENNTISAQNPSKINEFNQNDEDMMAAVLVATIDYQNEIKKDVKLVSVKEIK